jgi:hypothetical protein
MISDNSQAKPLDQTAVSGNRFVPMLFSTPMVQALLNGTKKETRRTQGLEMINENPNKFIYKGKSADVNYHLFTNISEPKGINETESIKSKIKIGDIIWVRETWGIDYFGSLRFWHFKECLNIEKKDIVYKADNENRDKDFLLSKVWKPSLFMPKEACRLFLKCVSVHAERLQDIDEQSAINEGVGKYKDTAHFIDYMSKLSDRSRFRFAVDSYKSLWQKINGKDSHKENPFVWVYKFVQVDAPGDFR